MKSILNHIILFICMCTVCSCKKFVEVGPPKNQVVTEEVFNNDNTANVAMTTIYANLFGQMASPYHLAFTTGLTGDELVNNSIGASDLYVNAINPVTSIFANLYWKVSYNNIYLANAVFEGCSASTSLSSELKKQLQAEAIFMRAYSYFNLVNLYGEIPLALTTDYKVNASLPKSSVEEVYKQIVTDLLYAQQNLKSTYVNADGVSESTLRVRPNQATATALLARVYLYLGRYQDAETQASILINNAAIYTLSPTLDAVFRPDSKEAIWQLMPVNNSNFNTVEGNQFIPGSSSVSEGKAIISDQLLAAFTPGDLRKTVWIKEFNDQTLTPARTYYFPDKYKVRENRDETEYSTIFRLAEQYLIRAEARNELGSKDGAIADLNAIRKRARAQVSVDVPKPLPDLQNSLSKEEVKAAILHERETELFTEQGHRWFDLKRTGKIDDIMKTVTPLKGGTWSSYKKLWPIPQTEIQNDPNLTQNKGY